MEIQLNPPQTRFVEALEHHKYILFGAGVGTGKTFLLCLMAVYLAQRNAGHAGLIASHRYNHLQVELIPTLTKLLKQAGLFKKHLIQKRVFELKNGSIIQYGSADNDASLEGRNVAWALGDEMRFWSRRAYEFFLARMRVKDAPFSRFCGFSTLETNWLEDEWRDNPKRHVIYATTYENAINLASDYIENLEVTLSTQMFQLYVMAKWVSGSDVVYSDFDEKVTIEKDLYQPHHPIIHGVDFGLKAPAWLMAQYFDVCPIHGTKGCLHIIDEVMLDDTRLPNVVKEVQRKTAMYHYSDSKDLYCDPAGVRRDPVFGGSEASFLQSSDGGGYSVYYRTSSNTRSISVGLNIVASRLMNAKGERRLYIDERLAKQGNKSRGIVRAFKNYRWTERKEGKAVPKEPIHDEFSHVMDALRYICVNLFPNTAGMVA